MDVILISITIYFNISMLIYKQEISRYNNKSSRANNRIF
jgi:hypothetical protein